MQIPFSRMTQYNYAVLSTKPRRFIRDLFANMWAEKYEIKFGHPRIQGYSLKSIETFRKAGSYC